MAKQPDPDTVRALALADWLGVSEQTVRELAVRGVIVRRGRGLYALKASVRNYCDNMRQVVTGRGGEAQAATAAAERARLAKDARNWINAERLPRPRVHRSHRHQRRVCCRG
jgi:phage terminase Nu1 subunit (DNA packaging protein)